MTDVDAGGIPDGSRWLSEATPPDFPAPHDCTPAGVPSLWQRLYRRVLNAGAAQGLATALSTHRLTRSRGRNEPRLYCPHCPQSDHGGGSILPRGRFVHEAFRSLRWNAGGGLDGVASVARSPPENRSSYSGGCRFPTPGNAGSCADEGEPDEKMFRPLHFRLPIEPPTR